MGGAEPEHPLPSAGMIYWLEQRGPCVFEGVPTGREQCLSPPHQRECIQISLFTRLPILSSIPRASRPEHSPSEGGAESRAGSFEPRPLLVPGRCCLARAGGCLAFLRASRARRRLDWLRGPNLAFLGCAWAPARGCAAAGPAPALPGRDARGSPRDGDTRGCSVPSGRDESWSCSAGGWGCWDRRRDGSRVWECLPALVGMGSCHGRLCCLHMGLSSSSSHVFPPPVCLVWGIIYFKGFFGFLVFFQGCHIWQPFPSVTSRLAGTQPGWGGGWQQDPRAGGVQGTPRAGPGDKSSSCEKGTAWHSHPWGNLEL